MFNDKWLLYSLSCFFWWGIFGFLSKLGATRLSPEQMQVLFTFGTLPPVLAAWFHGGAKVDRDLTGMVYGGLMGLLGGLGEVAYFRALEVGNASLVGPVTSLFPALTVVLAVVFLKERTNWRQGIGILLALVSIFILSL